MNLRPIMNKLLVKQDDAETKSQGGIIIPDSVKSPPRKGVVLSIGPECEDVKVGDIVYWTNYGGEELNKRLLGDGYWLLRETDVMVIYEP